MKKLILLILLLFTAELIFSDEITFPESRGKSEKKVNLDEIDKKLEGKAKLGLSLGYPTGITFGYQMTDLAELNATVGLFDFDSISAGGSLLFSLFDLVAGDAVMPVSAGPAFYFHSGNRTKVDVLGILRMEYSFEESPLNIFIEGGAGIRTVPDTGFTGSGALGIRYIF